MLKLLSEEFLCSISIVSYAKELVLSVEDGGYTLDETLLEGHLGITRELLLFQTSQKKFAVGSQREGSNLIKVMFKLCSKIPVRDIDFIF